MGGISILMFRYVNLENIDDSLEDRSSKSLSLLIKNILIDPSSRCGT